jgi:hypothetical protein
MVNPSRPPLSPNKPYHQPFNYLKYVRNFNPNVNVKVFKVAIKANNETNDAKIVNIFSFTLKHIVSNWCNNYMGYYPNCIFAKLQLAFYKRYKKV